MGQMKEYKQLLKELPSKSVVFAFGRFNPPTTGHELLMKVVQRLAQQKRADHIVYASASHNTEKDPLTLDKKLRYLKLMFPRLNFMGTAPGTNALGVAVDLYKKGYKNIIMIAGSDRVAEFKTALPKYNGVKGLRHGYYKFDTIEIISSGQRDPDSTDATGMSGTKMREQAKKGKFKEFKKGLPTTMREIDARRLMNDVRMGMGLSAVREQIELPKDDIRERYFQGEIFNVGDIVESEGQHYEIVKRGSNHLLVREDSGELVSKWIHDVKESHMNEELTNKTLRKSDRMKVGRMIAMMLGVDKPESMSNPEALVNMGLRKVRMKPLNKESLRLVDKILELARQMEINYDRNLIPNKLKEGVMQPNGTDKININASKTDRVAPTNKKRKDNIGSDILSPSDFKKLSKMNQGGYKEEAEGKETESDHDADMKDAPAHTQVGGLMAPPYAVKDDNLRRRMVNYHLGEASDPLEKARKEKAKAQLAVKHAKERENLSKDHQREKEAMTNEAEVNELLGYARYTQKPKTIKKTVVKDEPSIQDKIKARRKAGDWSNSKTNEQLEENTEALKKKASKSGVSLSVLKKVYARGVAAWNSGHRPGTTPQQWGMARVNSYITKGKGTYHGADKDLREHYDSRYDTAVIALEEAMDTIAAADKGEFDYEGAMARTQLQTIARNAQELIDMLQMNDNLPEWVQSKITMAKDYVTGVNDYLKSRMELGEAREVPKDKHSGEPKKYVAGLSKSTAKARAAHWDKMDKLDDKDPAAYEPAPGDATAKTKPSKHTIAYKKKFGESTETPAQKNLRHRKDLDDLERGIRKSGSMDKDMQKHIDDKRRQLMTQKEELEEAAKHVIPVKADKEGNLKGYSDKIKEEDIRDYEKDIQITDFSDKEIDKIIDDLSDDDYLEVYDDDELALVDDETGDEIPASEDEKEIDEEALMEVLSRAERMKAKFRIRRTKAKRQRATKIALKRYSNTKVINKRARRLAIKALKKRLLRGRNISKLSTAEKERVERIINNKKPLLKRIAMKLAPQVRRREKARMSHTKFTQGKASIF